MGREIKHVPANFEAPLDKTWSGFMMPKHLHSKECPSCHGGGYNPETQKISDEYYDLDNFGVTWSYEYYVAPDGSPATRPPWKILGKTARWASNLNQDEVNYLIEKDCLRELTHEFIDGKWVKKENVYITAEEVNILNSTGIGLSGSIQYHIVEYKANKLGVYGLCPQCEGDGHVYDTPEIKAQAEAWEPEKLPTGNWWQVWETVSEGSPVTPPFETREELVEYLVTYGDLWDQKRGDGGWSRESAEKFVQENGWKPSLLMVDGKIVK